MDITGKSGHHLAVPVEARKTTAPDISLFAPWNAVLAGRPLRRAIELYDQQLTIAREIGDKRGEGNAFGSMGLAYAALGEPCHAIELCEQWLAITREIGDKSGEGNASWNLGLCYEALGELDKAIALMRIRVDFLRALGHPKAEKRAAHVDKLHARLKG